MEDFQTPYFEDWPQISSAIRRDEKIEEEIEAILAEMTIEEKLGQMIQPNLRDITPEEVTHYKLGSILNGGGTWPNENRRASALDWAKVAEEFWQAGERVFEGRPFRIPFMWGTDAVHGHNNVFKATLFPHNIGLGAAGDPDLIRRIGEVTAREVAATGLDWTFAPTVAVPRDLRWGRVYEGYSEDPQITYAYAGQMVKGLQGSAEELKGQEKVLSNVKHWVGDGGTLLGVDRGENHYSESLLRNIHAMGYFSGLRAGAQIVMSSFNSWKSDANYDHDPGEGGEYNHKIHGSRYLLTDILKKRMGFDGLVVTDWNGHAEISKCSEGDATYAINAGNDILMVPVRADWMEVHKKALADIRTGIIPRERIDDAVRRILRVKKRAGLWEKPSPRGRTLAGKEGILGAPEHKALAREGVRKSLVLLKNEGDLLPLKKNQKILLTGNGANDLQIQSGGWTLTWQGDENTPEDFPGATTVKEAFERELGPTNVVYDPGLSGDLGAFEVAVVAFGEDPYAEMMGDIKPWQSLEYRTLKRSYRRDAEKIEILKRAKVKVVSLFFSGRPLYTSKEISDSTAFVAAFLPGSEGLGISDVLVGNAEGTPQWDFQGRLSFSWPGKKRAATAHRVPPHIPDYSPPDFEEDPSHKGAILFPYGYGLSYKEKKGIPGIDLNKIPLDEEPGGELQQQGIEFYGAKAALGDYLLKGADSEHPGGVVLSRNNPMDLTTLRTRPYNYQHQQDSMELEFLGGSAAVYLQSSDGSQEDLCPHATTGGILSFETHILKAPSAPVLLSLQREPQTYERKNLPTIDISPQLQETGTWKVLSFPLKELQDQGFSLDSVETPLVLTTRSPLHLILANIRLNF